VLYDDERLSDVLRLCEGVALSLGLGDGLAEYETVVGVRLWLLEGLSVQDKLSTGETDRVTEPLGMECDWDWEGADGLGEGRDVGVCVREGGVMDAVME